MSEKPILNNPQDKPRELSSSLSERGLGNISEEEQKAWHLIVPVHRRSAIKLSNLEGYVDPQMLQDDANYVTRMEARFQREDPPEMAAAHRRA